MKLSIVVNMYNTAKYMPRCMETLLEQDIPQSEYEIILVDDCSPDNSLEMAREYAAQYKNVRICTHERNKGLAAARNTGIDAAKGQYLCFVDPDDYVEPNVYGKLVKQMEEENLDMLRFNYQSVDEDYQLVDKSAFEKRFDYSPKLMSGAEFLATRLDIACNIWRYMYRREIITENNIWCFTGDYYDDTPWLPLVLLKAERMNICDTVVYDYLERADSLVKSNHPKMMKRKTDGYIMLLNFFEDERMKVESGMLKVESKWKDGVIAWYKRMEAHSIVSLLTGVGTALYSERKAYIQQLRELNVFPIQDISMKAKIANISPRLLVFFIHLKNR